jgi:rhodanese-related sulfurtransferase
MQRMTVQPMTQRKPSRKLMIRAFTGAVVAAGVVILVSTLSPAHLPWTLDPADPRVSLEDVEREVIRRYPVPDIVPATLAAMLSRGEVTLFDVRTLAEYEAGHLPGAVRIEPGSSAADFLAAHRDKLEKGPVVFYCAVGVRSSQIMSATLREIAPHSRAGAYNLRGGVFRWTAEGRSLVKGAAQGEAHPFDESWGQLLARTAPR